MLCNVPPRNPIFTGYDDLLASLSQGFQQSPLMVLHGPEGMGKTQIAMEYCYRSSSTSTTILWLNASSRGLLAHDVSISVNRLLLPQEIHEDEPSLFSSLKQWLYHHTAWLLVLDHLDDLSLIDLILPAEQLRGHLLITTRHAPIGPSSSSPAPDDLSEPTRHLLQQAGFIVEQEMPELPLSHRVKTLMVKTIGASLTTAFALFQQRQATFSKENAEAYDAFQQEEVEQLFLAFSRTLPASLLDILRLLTFFYPEAIPQGLFLKVTPTEIPEPLSSLLADYPALEQALEDLVDEELLSRPEEDGSLLHLHPGLEIVLVQSLANDQQRIWAGLVVRLLNHVFPEVRFDTQDDCQRYFALAQRCATLIAHYQLPLKDAASLLERLGAYCFWHAFYAKAEMYLIQALELSAQHHPQDTQDTAQTMNSLARLSAEQARYPEAEALHLRALALREQELGPDDPKTAESLHNLAMVYGDLGQYQRAEELSLRVLSLEEKNKGTDHPDVASTLNNLGLLYYYQGRDALAETTYRRVLTIYEHSLPSDHPDWAYPLDGLGALAERQGKTKQAEAFYQQALTICTHAFGEQHPETAHAMNKLADIAESQGNDQQAKALYLQALGIGEHVLGPEHPDVALFLHNLAFLTAKQGLYQQAKPLYQRALSIYERTFGSEHPDVASVLNNLGQLFRKTGDLDRAEALFRRAFAIHEQALDRTHPDTALILVNLANVLCDRGAGEDAEPLLQRALALRLQTREPEHAEVVSIQGRLAALQKRRNTNKKE